MVCKWRFSSASEFKETLGNATPGVGGSLAYFIN
jgi:hypothetical protein